MQSLRRYLETSPSIPERQDTWRRIAILCEQSQDVLGVIQALVELATLQETNYDEISNAANKINQLFRDAYLVVDTEEKRVLVGQLALVMKERVNEANATDCSRLAWLFLNANDEQNAMHYAEKGLEMEPENSHCTNLVERMQRVAKYRNYQ